MLELIFLTIIPVALLIGLTLFIVVTLHELGHAIPALIMTSHDVTIYIGSYGSRTRCFRIAIGQRLTLFCKYNPILWFRGCCFSFDYELSLNQKLLYVAGGPIASMIGTLISWCILTISQDAGLFRVISGSVFIVSLMITLLSFIPLGTVQYTPEGQPVYNDGYQIFTLLRRKYR